MKNTNPDPKPSPESQAIDRKLREKFGACPACKPKPTAQPTVREVPTVYRGGVLMLEWFRKITFWERLCILFGANIVVQVGIACQHSAGKIQPVFLGRVSKDTTATNLMRERAMSILEDQAKGSHGQAQ